MATKIKHRMYVHNKIDEWDTSAHVRFAPTIQVLCKTDGGGVSNFPVLNNFYEGVRFNVISVTRGWVGV